MNFFSYVPCNYSSDCITSRSQDFGAQLDPSLKSLCACRRPKEVNSGLKRSTEIRLDPFTASSSDLSLPFTHNRLRRSSLRKVSLGGPAQPLKRGTLNLIYTYLITSRYLFWRDFSKFPL